MLTDGGINHFPNEVVPQEIEAILIARWMQGAVTLDWLLEHPDWYAWCEIVKMALEQAQAELNKTK